MDGIALQTEWGGLVAVYLFLGGLAGGTLCLSALIDLKGRGRFARTVRFGAWAGTLCLIAGVLCLLVETSMPNRSIMLWRSFANPTSWMTIGAWLLFCGIVVSGVYALSTTAAVTARLGFLARIRKGLARVVAPLSVCIAVYTGILLGVLTAHPLWNTWLLPALFTVSALDTGVALVSGYAVVREPAGAEGLAHLRALLERATIALVLAELAVLAIYLGSVASGGGVAAASVGLLVSGPLAGWFWGLLVACGLAAPLAISVLLSRRAAPAASPAAPDAAKADAAEAGAPRADAESAAMAALSADAPAEGAAPAAAPAIPSRAWALPVLAAALCLTGGCALRFLILLAGLPVHM